MLGIALGYREFRPRARGLLHEVLHRPPFAGAVEFNRARLETVRPPSSSRVQVREREFEFRSLVGGPGFEPGASRSRTVGKFLQKCRKQSHSVRIFRRGAGSRPDLSHSSAGLLHEVLQKAAARHGDGSHRAEGRCAEPGPHAGHTYSGRAHSPTPRGFEDRDSDVHERPLMSPSDRLLSLSIP
jgi:hypothetical protein